MREGSVPVPDPGEPPLDQDEAAGAEGTVRGTGTGTGRSTGRVAAALGVLVGIEFVLGIVTLVYVPTGRPTGWLPANGASIYLVHAILGLPLAIGAVALLLRVRRSTRIDRLCGWIGCIGVAMAGVGGLLTVAHPLRLVGLAFMLLGPMIAGFGYLLPTLDRLTGSAAPVGGS